ncbi:MAG: UDP-N-acetylmuramoyl-L-alanine--D-glutamate ligase [Victivallales bacterium]|nr:UDP-N-acetylmuramoyl-L-alanine--D-glutamate ligase [Victivallales bacterium]
MKNILILGAGNSGKSAAKLARLQGDSVILLDSGSPDVQIDGVQVITGKAAEAWSGPADLVIYSPGIPLGSRLDEIGCATGAPRISELAYGASFLKCPVLAVTGTNGKTTTVEMLEHCLNAAGHHAIAAGNIGLPISEVVASGKIPDILVAEVSSFQLEHPGNFAPTAATILNITPDHLVRHHTMEAYIDAKLSIFASPSTKCSINDALLQINQVAITLHNRIIVSFSATSNSKATFRVEDDWLVKDAGEGTLHRLVKVSDLPFSGMHNLENALAALALSDTAGIDALSIAPHLKTFTTGAHRLQKVNQIGGTLFIDDSKATNVDALIKALQTLKENPDTASKRIALIAGGVDKECSLDEAIPFLKASVCGVFLIGRCAQRLHASWGRHVKTHLCPSMAEAVRQAYASIPEGGIVLLSPACASQDMYHDYAERGDDFKASSMKLTTG